ncbi:hypothetical protein BD777DRAFT_32371 [Yarrowia lipolytica]|jgi:hypothetical protein|uniref:Uncharacterized protein n=1 Tax=Yarrowia lipolytica TaxID=4952 RepID=A0A1D8NDX0_YARLL|nr:hypothetical protein YALI1_D11913g [Yarrowia lipolytica]RMI99674.1 hypothetical protein BD777DRAFT_32371 [Yarrowia lipolytica]
MLSLVETEGDEPSGPTFLKAVNTRAVNIPFGRVVRGFRQLAAVTKAPHSRRRVAAQLFISLKHAVRQLNLLKRIIRGAKTPGYGLWNQTTCPGTKRKVFSVVVVCSRQMTLTSSRGHGYRTTCIEFRPEKKQIRVGQGDICYEYYHSVHSYRYQYR